MAPWGTGNLPSFDGIVGQSRATDLVARFGGEEFLVCVPGTDVAGAMIFAEKLRVAIADSQMPIVGRITISLGVAECLAEDSGELDAVNRADQGLYRAKGNGRNCVSV